MRKVPIVVLISAVALNALVLSLELSVESSSEIKKGINIRGLWTDRKQCCNYKNCRHPWCRCCWVFMR
ncbi:Hypothetical predicted protein [Mytilus galloprovincialis]|uniref:Uncharacterized protein n=1 Tax=Mytilus galloprovincialis TaxID=29158 RepID=A0A8B6CHA4_MYTGA|nr:Hypothetical predicted protein [Mytilus galloprovincialis]